MSDATTPPSSVDTDGPADGPAVAEAAADGRESAPGSGAETGLGDAGTMLSSAVISLARVLLRRGRKTAKRAAEGSRVRLDLRQLRRDRDVMYQKLGKEVRALLEGGELSHPGLERGVARIEELEARIREVEEELAARAAAARVEAARGESSGESADEETADELEAPGEAAAGSDSDTVGGA